MSTVSILSMSKMAFAIIYLMPDPKRLLPITYFNLAGKNLNPKRCIYKRNQSTLTTAGNPKITTHPSIVGRTGEEWEGKLFY